MPFRLARRSEDVTLHGTFARLGGLSLTDFFSVEKVCYVVATSRFSWLHAIDRIQSNSLLLRRRLSSSMMYCYSSLVCIVHYSTQVSHTISH